MKCCDPHILSQDLNAIEIETIQIRELSATQKFKQWLQQNVLESKEDAVREYIESLRNPSWIETTPAKILRIGVQGVGGAVGSLFGDPYITPTLLSVADSFLLNVSST